MTAEYDPDTCLTASELRFCGIKIPEEIPDCAWAPRSAVRFGSVDVDVESGGKYHLSGHLYFTEPWRWVQVEMTLPPGVAKG